HRDVSGILADHRVEDGDDVRVAQLAGERGLVQQLPAIYLAELRIAEHLGLDGLQRHFLAGERVAREVDRSSRALAEQLLDVVFADLQRKVEREGGCIAHGFPSVLASAQCTSKPASSPLSCLPPRRPMPRSPCRNTRCRADTASTTYGPMPRRTAR